MRDLGLLLALAMSCILLGCGGGDSDSQPPSWEQVEQLVTATAEHTNFLAAEIDDEGQCVSIAGSNRGGELALGSTFKLYVLATLADEIAQSRVAWSDVLTIRNAWKSLPSGRLHLEAEGTPFTLEEFATLMISISDNTATDHLLFHLGRQRVETTLALAGHAMPALNIPFLATRELFLFRGALTAQEVAAYLTLDTEARRIFLETELVARDVNTVQGWQLPRNILELEWFASPNDLCAVMSVLRIQMMQPTGEPVSSILSENPGISFGDLNWPFIGFKGGSEPGVLNLTWLLRRADNRWFFLTFGYNNTRGTIDIASPLSAARLAASLLLAE